MPVQSPLESLVQNMTLKQLAEQTGPSVAEIVEWAMRQRAPKNGTHKSAGPSAAAATKVAKKVDVRNAAGRIAYDNAVLQLLTSIGEPTSAAHVREQLGGTPTQARASLNRLIHAKKVGYEGRARATRYFAKRRG